jgi:hypothetical protein
MCKYYHVEVDGKPLESMGVIQVYSPAEAAKKARIFEGKVVPLTEEENAKEVMKAALVNLKNAFCEVLEASENTSEFDPEKYPFDRCFRELTDKVIDWVDSEIESRRENVLCQK